MTAKSETAAQTAKTLKQQDCILLLTHENPDGDTLGSARALCLALRALGKRARVENGGEIPEKYAFLMPKEPFFEEKYVVAVDCATPQRLGSALFEKYSGRFDMVIDHHETNTRYGAHDLVDGDSASCGEIVFEVIKEMGVPVTPEIARALYTAVSTDTGCFRHANTTAACHRAAAELMGLAGDVSDLNYKFFTLKSAARIYLERCVYSSFRPVFGGRVMLASITAEDLEKSGGTEADKDDLSDLPRTVEGVELGALFKETQNGDWRVSVRTNGPRANAAEVCAVLGGGGHKGAAGCTVTGTLDEAYAKFCAALEGMF